ncbi:MAG: arsenate reductase ArsC [Caldilineaceae bacterium]
MKRTVLILCTGNSARSQMAEGLINHFLGETWQAFSAGTKPAGYVHPMAMYVMQEIGIDIHGHHSKSLEEFRGQRFDQVITVCDSAAQDCPLWLGGGKRIHIGFEDPALVSDNEAKQLIAFRQCRDQIRQRVVGYLQGIIVEELKSGNVAE